MVFDVAIAGGGLCGLALAEALAKTMGGQGLAVVLIEAREQQGVLALPPRLVAQNVSFSPHLRGEILSAMQQTPT